MTALVVAMVWNLPKKCNPITEWYQGSVIYEIFPASFSDSNNDGIGDFLGIANKTDYIQFLNVRAIRLNSIFSSIEYPENYKNITSLTEIATPLGTLMDFAVLINSLHDKNISLILDIPVYPFVKRLSPNNPSQIFDFNDTEHKPSVEFLRSHPFEVTDPISDALLFWVNRKVDGFYLKDFKHLVDDVNFPSSLRRWKKIIGQNRILITNYETYEVIPNQYKNIFLNNIDLIDVRLKIEEGIGVLSKQLESIQNSTLFKKPGRPWVQWTLGDETTDRLANRLPISNATLGATLLQLMLPGTPSIFYGDEIGLRQVLDEHEDRKDIMHLLQLTPMMWKLHSFTGKNYLAWIHGRQPEPNFDQALLVSKMIEIRIDSPSIYMNSMIKDDGSAKANAEIKYSQDDLFVVQRWFPRRKSYVVVCNFGRRYVSTDLSKLFYSGKVVVGPEADSKPESISFKDIALRPGEAVIIELD